MDTTIHVDELRKVYEGDADLDGPLYQALYERLMDQMPYGTAKARTGDPSQWIFDWMQKSKSFEELCVNLGLTTGG
jgi:hypothetical protein